jgi:hypothetical protein
MFWELKSRVFWSWDTLSVYDKLKLLSQKQNSHFIWITNVLVFHMGISLSATISWYMVSSLRENTIVQYCDLTLHITWFVHDKHMFKISVQLCVHFLCVFSFLLLEPSFSLTYMWKPTYASIIIQFISYVWWLLHVSALHCLVSWCVHHDTRHNTPIHNILPTAPSLRRL